MTKTAKKLMAELKKLSEEEQEKYAALFLKELEADRRWERLLSQTTEKQWDKLTSEAIEEAERGELVPLEETLGIE
ncbi:MAG: hypothetical protein ABEL04_08590 [Salinibacter sp.]|uniref:hypothetical protein n=1 Tax=Salinibacter sp. TaxID=2065818 RepID=UPI0035D4FCBC